MIIFGIAVSQQSSWTPVVTKHKSRGQAEDVKVLFQNEKDISLEIQLKKAKLELMKRNFWSCSELSGSFVQIKTNINFFLPQTSVFYALSTKEIYAWILLVITYIRNITIACHSSQMRKEHVPFLSTDGLLLCHWEQHICGLACLYLLLQWKCEISCNNYFNLCCEPNKFW